MTGPRTDIVGVGRDQPAEDKKMVWIDTDLESPMHQFSFYDQADEVLTVVDNGAQWFLSKL